MYENDWIEKRRSLRVKNSLPTQYQSIVEGKHGTGITQDISENGLKMTMEEFIPRFSRVSVTVNLKPDKMIVLNGKVQWTHEVAYSSRYQIGLCFEDISFDAKRSIAEYVATHR